MTSQKLVFGQFAAQRVAVDAEHLRGERLVAVGLAQDDFEHRALDVADNHVVDGAGLLAVEILEIVFQRAPDAVGDFAAAGWAGFDSCCEFLDVVETVVLRGEVEEEGIDRGELCSIVGNWFMAWRKAAEPASPLVYQEMCLRAMRTPVSLP